nr:unnamed protein product [Callosobruchus chinensis]
MKDTRTRSQKVKENLAKKHACMFNRELRVAIRREIEEKTQVRSNESCRSKRNKVSNKLQQKHPLTRPEYVEKENMNKLGQKLKGNTENKENYCLVVENQKSNSSINIDKFHQKCLVKLVSAKYQQDDKQCILRDSTTSNIEGSSKTENIVGNSCDATRSSNLYEECTTPKSNEFIFQHPTSKSNTLEASIVRCDGDDDNGDISVTKFRKASAIVHSDILGIQTSTPLRRSNPTTPVAKRLRDKAKKNYRESSLSLAEAPAEAETPSCPVGNKVPVYKRIVPDDHKPKADLYEFDDVEFDIQCRRKRKNTSERFDKTMHSILEKLEKRERTNKRCMKNHKTINKKIPIYETKVNAAVEKVMDKIKAKRHAQNRLTSKQNNCKENNENEPQMQNQLVLGDNKNRSCQLRPLNEEISNNKRRNGCKILKENNIQQQKINKGYNKLENYNDTANKIIDTNDINITNQNENYNNTINTAGNSNHVSEDNINLSEFQGFSNTRSMLVLEHSDDTDSFHGFDDLEPSGAIEKSFTMTNHLSSTFEKTDTSINILGNIVLQPAQKHIVKKIAPCDYFIDLHENYTLDNNFGFDYDERADSSMMAQARKIIRKIVWRFATVIKRNPHFLLIKSNALPCLDQELVINYALVEWIEKLAASKHTKNPLVINDTVAKVTYQKKISEYLECPVTLEKDREKVVLSSGLYDYEEFHIPVRPRRVLGVLQNGQVISTPKKRVETSVPFPDVSIIEKDTEMQNGPYIEEDTENNPPGHSLRIRADICGMRKYSKKSKDKQDVVEKVVVVTHQQQLSNSDADSDIVTTDEKQNRINDDRGEDDIQLFDEDEPELLENVSITIPKMNYPSKRRKRLKSDASDMDDEEKPKKKKKDLMTREEEMEFEKWASKFNAMCEEVDKYELEVD